MKRPESLAEVAAWSASRESCHRHFADFLDQFSLSRRPEMLMDEPRILAGRIDEGAVADAYLAAAAVYLERKVGANPPRWVWNGDRKLRSPWFANRGRAIRATLLAESPAPFRERILFVSENALSRA